ncbi:MAG TPA: dUTP diphosphatase [Bacillota bacterium]|jgi:dUTP pyrophosphatase|nr:dUTP diphosphatase [Bacillota bacterium]
MKIKITTQGGDLPSYETEGSAGMDIRAFVKEPVKLDPGERKLIPTGIAIELPKGYEAQIRARSGLSVKFGIGLVNGVGTIDSDYRGEIKVGLINLGEDPYTINNGDRIAQMIIAKYETAEWELSDELNRSSRGSGGFGHTGI